MSCAQPHHGKHTKKYIWCSFYLKATICLSMKETELLHVSLVLMNQWWAVGRGSMKKWLKTKRQRRLSEVRKADSLKLKKFLLSVCSLGKHTESRRLKCIHRADPTEMKWKWESEGFLRLFNSDTKEEDFSGFGGQEEGEQRFDDFSIFFDQVFLPPVLQAPFWRQAVKFYKIFLCKYLIFQSGYLRLKGWCGLYMEKYLFLLKFSGCGLCSGALYSREITVPLPRRSCFCQGITFSKFNWKVMNWFQWHKEKMVTFWWRATWPSGSRNFSAIK